MGDDSGVELLMVQEEGPHAMSWFQRSLEGWSRGHALVGEFLTLFLQIFTVLVSAVISVFDYSSMACFAIGLAVLLGRSLLIQIDGLSINPTRSFGPAVVAWITGRKKDTFQGMWVFWVGPLAGAAAAAGVPWGPK